MVIEVLWRSSLPEFHASQLERLQRQQDKDRLLARHEADFRAVAEAELEASELRGLSPDPDRAETLARLLAGGADWTEAVKALGGAFASEPGLRDLKRDIAER